ncbi:hypothetical protein ACFX1Z_031957 [Malus domestica]
MTKQIFYIDDPKARRGWKVVQRDEHKGVYDIPDRDPLDNDDDDNFANQLLETSLEIGAETLQDRNIVQEPF